MKGFRLLLCGIASIGLQAQPQAGFADKAEATTYLNVRTIPGGGSALDALAPGELVEVIECTGDGWCRIEHDGPDGWVSTMYLTISPELGTPPAPECTLKVAVALDGPDIGLRCGAPDPLIPEDKAAALTENMACFYADADFGGKYFCLPPGALSTLPALFDNRISSLRLYGEARVTLCRDGNLEGTCHYVTQDMESMTRAINNKASSLKVATTSQSTMIVRFPMAIPEPVKHAAGTFELVPGGAFDLDGGTQGAADADFALVAEDGAEARLEPANGASLVYSGRNVRGYFACRDENMSTDAIAFAELSFSAYVCLKTSQGRVAQMRVNDNDGSRLEITYTTWEK